MISGPWIGSAEPTTFWGPMNMKPLPKGAAGAATVTTGGAANCANPAWVEKAIDAQAMKILLESGAASRGKRQQPNRVRCFNMSEA